MSNPVLVEVLRGCLVESSHRGAVAVIDADGAMVAAVGDIAKPVFPRSAVKPLQALPLVESGAADRYAFGDEELALACASHSGESAHVEVVTPRPQRCITIVQASTLASSASMAALIARFVRLDDAERAIVAGFAGPTLRNWNGIEVGSLRVSDAIAGALPR